MCIRDSGIETEDFEKFYDKFTEYKEYLDSSRPTAVNLSWALKRMNAVAVKAGREEHKTVAEVKEILHDEALQIRAEDVEVCRKIGEFGLELVKPGDGILTHCNAGQLATVKYGTATAPVSYTHLDVYKRQLRDRRSEVWYGFLP